MFSKRKRNYTLFVYIALIITSCMLIAAILWPEKPEIDKDDSFGPVQEVQKEQKVDSNDDKNKDIAKSETETNTSNKNESYYIVLKEGVAVSVFFVDSKGDKIKLEDTEILYDLLTVEDQQRFDKGIVIKNQEQLASLLQDYES